MRTRTRPRNAAANQAPRTASNTMSVRKGSDINASYRFEAELPSTARSFSFRRAFRHRLRAEKTMQKIVMPKIGRGQYSCAGKHNTEIKRDGTVATQHITAIM